MDLRLEFVMLAEQPGANVSALCRRFGISRKTGYKWLSRARSGPMDLSDLSRRPRSSPRRTPKGMEASVLAVRSDHPCWGGRKIARRLADLGETDVPAPSTVTAILRRHGVALGQAGTPAAFQRFERLRPNELWQMDFKGHFALAQGRCHPLTVLDDCSRFNLCLAACGNEQGETVQGHLRAAFRRYGLPEWIIVDNGSPWGDGPNTPYSLRLPRHRPQSQPSLSSSDAGQGRALPPHAEGRTAGRSALRRSRALTAGASSTTRPTRPSGRAHRVRARTSGPPRPTKAASASRARSSNCPRHSPPGRTGANHSGRNMEGDLRKPPPPDIGGG